MAGFCFFR
ncbi:hypothetical protein YPPY63_4767, partial [Yersinia pestis PY-63]